MLLVDLTLQNPPEGQNLHKWAPQNTSKQHTETPYFIVYSVI